MNVMDISNEDTMPGKGSTPKILFKRPGSRDMNSGGFPGLVNIQKLHLFFIKMIGLAMQ